MMNEKIRKVLSNSEENYISPFLWLHGESEGKLREYMKVIHESNLNAVCVESRPHPDFCGEKWWRDMDVILDEAKKRGMKVWILDDSHFPTGFANGEAAKAPARLRRQSIYCKAFQRKGKRNFSCSLPKLVRKIPTTFMGNNMSRMNQNGKYKFDDDRVLGVAVKVSSDRRLQEIPFTQDGDKVRAVLPENTDKVYVTFLTRNAGIHRSYINMMDEESCRILIDAVYEPHWEHYREEFGKTIAGFFSDEPEIGNGVYFENHITVGQDFDLPWSRELERILHEKLGEDWIRQLPLLWENDAPKEEKARVRYVYMDTVTRLVEKNFSKQAGAWCEEHGVEYIGHIIEDNNQHARLGSSLGHYFRGLSGQHMAGIDCIGGQVIPHKEDAPAEGIQKMLGGRDGEFYHYALGKLGASYAAIDPLKKGRCMCEIFGNYGWSEGPRMEKQLADHFLVRGVNRFVPHAFSPKEYPDKDCPPHFYANGHNPGYRAFGQLMAYMNRVCALLSGGRAVLDTAIIYHGDMEWAGEAMLLQKPARVLTEHQIDFHILPCDVFVETERYRTVFGAEGEGLHVGGNTYHTVIIPYAQYIPRSLADAVGVLKKAGCDVVFMERLPEGVSDGGELPERVNECAVLALEKLPERAGRKHWIVPQDKKIRVYHYIGAVEEGNPGELYYLVNEGEREYSGDIFVPVKEGFYEYDPWEDKEWETVFSASGQQAVLPVHLYAGESRIIIAGKKEGLGKKPDITAEGTELKARWERAVCRAADYPNFKDWKPVDRFEDYGKTDKNFSGYIAYRAQVEQNNLVKKGKNSLHGILKITQAGEDVEVFVNGKSAGIQVIPPFCYDISPLLQPGNNEIRIEVATTLERERKVNKKQWQPVGIFGKVEVL